ALNTLIKLARAMDTLESRMLENFAQLKLTPTQWGVLETLYHLGSLPQCDLGRKLLKSSPNITIVLDNLETAGLVRRDRTSQDRRLVTVSLTDQGKKLIEEAFPKHAARLADLFAVLTPQEQEELARISKKLGLALSATGVAA